MSAWDVWSRQHCLAICSTFVPLLLGLTGVSVLALWFPVQRRYLAVPAGLAGGCGGVLCLHVLSWLHVGVVQPATFILAGLSLLCGLVNGGVVWRGRTRAT
ncbi:hypothetical protein [Gloeomargarita sp.]